MNNGIFITENKKIQDIFQELNESYEIIHRIQELFQKLLCDSPGTIEIQEITAFLDEKTQLGTEEEIKEIQNKIKQKEIRIAVKLRELCKCGYMPFITSLISINFNTNKPDKFFDFFIDHVPVEEIKKDLPQFLMNNRNNTKEDNGEKEDKKNMNTSFMSYPPLIPHIACEKLLLEIFTDKSYFSPSEFLELTNEDKFNNKHNSKLSMKGRSILELILFDILNEKYPDICETDLYVFRYKLLSDQILSKLAFGYNLIEHYKYNISNELPLNCKLQIFAKLTLSYVAGLLMDGYTMIFIKSWVEKLYMPIIEDFKNSKSLKFLKRSALAELNFLFKKVFNIYQISQEECDLKFLQLESDPFVVKLSIKGKSFGVGTSSTSFEEAKERAAADALGDNEKLETILKFFVDEFQNKKNHNILPIFTEKPHNSNINFVEQNKFNNEYTPQVKDVNMMSIIDTFSSPDNSLLVNNSKINDNNNLLSQLYSHQQNNVQFQQRNIFPVNTNQTYLPSIITNPVQQNIKLYNSSSNSVQLQRYSNENNPKKLLHIFLFQKKMLPVYRYSKIGNDFQTTISVNDVVIGVGYNSNKKIASQIAAMNALSNKNSFAFLNQNIN